MCLATVCAQFHIEDPVIWRKTEVKHIEGQVNIAVNLMFHDPCPAIFKNRTQKKDLDASMVETCSLRFKKNVLDILNDIDKEHGLRKSRDAGATIAVIAAISAVIATVHQKYTHDGDLRIQNRENMEFKNMITQLDERISALSDKLKISNSRTSDTLSGMISSNSSDTQI